MKIINFLNLTVFMVFGCLLSSNLSTVDYNLADSIESSKSISSYNFSNFQEIEEEEEDLELTLNSVSSELNNQTQFKLITPKIINPIIFRYNSIWKPPQIS